MAQINISLNFSCNHKGIQLNIKHSYCGQSVWLNSPSSFLFKGSLFATLGYKQSTEMKLGEANLLIILHQVGPKRISGPCFFVALLGLFMQKKKKKPAQTKTPRSKEQNIFFFWSKLIGSVVSLLKKLHEHHL